MDRSSWLEEVRRQLQRQGAAPEDARRLSEELNDHIDDLKEQMMLTESDAMTRMGQPERIATSYRRRSWIGLLKFLAFAVSPPFALGASLVLSMNLLRWLGESLGIVGDADVQLGDAAKAASPYVLSIATLFIPSMLLSLSYWKAAGWLGIERKWPIISIVLMATLSGMSTFQVNLVEGTGRGSIMFGIGTRSALQLAQFVLPIACCWWLMRRNEATREHS